MTASPVLALAIWKENYTVRQINYIWQWICFGMFALVMVVLLILIMVGGSFIETLCKGGSQDLPEGGSDEL